MKRILTIVVLAGLLTALAAPALAADQARDRTQTRTQDGACVDEAIQTREQSHTMEQSQECTQTRTQATFSTSAQEQTRVGAPGDAPGGAAQQQAPGTGAQLEPAGQAYANGLLDGAGPVARACIQLAERFRAVLGFF